MQVPYQQNNPKNIQFGIYKYQHAQFGPLMLLLDLQNDEHQPQEKQKEKKQSNNRRSIHRIIGNENQKNKFSTIGQQKKQKPRYNDDHFLQIAEKVQSQKKRNLSGRPPLQLQKKYSTSKQKGKFDIGVTRLSVQKQQKNNSIERKRSIEANGFALPNISRKK